MTGGGGGCGGSGGAMGAIGGRDVLGYRYGYAGCARGTARRGASVAVPRPRLAFGGLLAAPPLRELRGFFAFFAFFDRVGYTRRVNDEHRLRGGNPFARPGQEARPQA